MAGRRAVGKPAKYSDGIDDQPVPVRVNQTASEVRARGGHRYPPRRAPNPAACYVPSFFIFVSRGCRRGLSETCGMGRGGAGVVCDPAEVALLGSASGASEAGARPPRLRPYSSHVAAGRRAHSAIGLDVFPVRVESEGISGCQSHTISPPGDPCAGSAAALNSPCRHQSGRAKRQEYRGDAPCQS